MNIDFSKPVTNQIFTPVFDGIFENSYSHKGVQLSLLYIPFTLCLIIETIARSIFAFLTLPFTIYYANENESIFNITLLKESANVTITALTLIFTLPFETDSYLTRD